MAMDQMDKWLAGQNDVVVDQVEAAKKLGRNSYDDGVYLLQYLGSNMQMDKNDNPGIATRYKFLEEGEYFGEEYFQWQGLTRDDAWQWVGKHFMDVGVDVDPATLLPIVRKTRDDIYNLSKERIVLKVQLLTKNGYQNVRIQKVIDVEIVEVMGLKTFDPEQAKKDREERKVNAGKTSEKNASNREANQAAQTTPKTATVPDTETADESVDVAIGTRLSFRLVERKGAKKTEKIVTGTVSAIDEENKIFTVVETDGKAHEIEEDDITEVHGNDNATV